MPGRDHISKFFLSKELKFISSRKHKGGYLWEVEKIQQHCEICPKCATPTPTAPKGRPPQMEVSFTS